VEKTKVGRTGRVANMKLRRKIAVGLASASVAAIVCAFLLSSSDNSGQKTVDETRRALRQEGFKTDLAEFDFPVSYELRVRAGLLAMVGQAVQSRRPDNPSLITPVGSNAAIVVWRQGRSTSRPGADLWPTLRESLSGTRVLSVNRPDLDAACEAALAGPIRFDPNVAATYTPLLPPLAQTLGTRAVLELHDGNKDAAWTNLLASTRLVTAWEPGPAEIAHLVRYACAAIVFNATWQTLQAGGWADDRLALLQQEWESAGFLQGLPETAAFARASAVATCQLERRQALTLGLTLQSALRSPRSVWHGLSNYWRRRRYRQQGTYEDEMALLLHYRDRELELRRALRSPTWSEMRSLPGVTNQAPFQSKHSSTALIMLNGQLQPQGLLGRAADAEVRRRLIITAIALERYRGRQGSYPATLQELVPDLLKNAPVDFMDGQPLRYRRRDDGRFVLYSAGSDCADNGGQMRRERRRWMADESASVFGTPEGTDLVWPRPASGAEIQAHEEEEKRAEKEARQAMLSRTAQEEKEAALQRERTLAKLAWLYAQKQPRMTKEPIYQGRPLSQVLRSPWAPATDRTTLDGLLTLKQVTTGKEPDIATFEVPISYAVVTNIGALRLLVDADPDGEDSDVKGGEFQGCERAANGNCLLVWNTTFDPPGKHFLQAQLLYEEQEESAEVKGPLVPFVSSNLCQFDPFYSEFDSKGGILYARLPESNGTYTIELKSPSGVPVRTFTGSTSNGVIQVHWDLTDERGKTYTNESVDSVFHVTLPDSGRSQTLKGP
jgi:hypothetical protein